MVGKKKVVAHASSLNLRIDDYACEFLGYVKMAMTNKTDRNGFKMNKQIFIYGYLKRRRKWLAFVSSIHFVDRHHHSVYVCVSLSSCHGFFISERKRGQV